MSQPIALPQDALNSLWVATFPYRRPDSETRADLLPRNDDWPTQLRILHLATTLAFAAWDVTQTALSEAPQDKELRQLTELLMLGFVVSEHDTRWRILAWEHEHLATTQDEGGQ